jgi:hypothetical protein
MQSMPGIIRNQVSSIKKLARSLDHMGHSVQNKAEDSRIKGVSMQVFTKRF